MQALLIDQSREPGVEIDRCPGCGGVWFDFGEPEALSTRALPFEPLPGATTTRRCPDCTLTLTPGTMPHVTTVEVCTACRGAWFDHEDLVVLQSRTVTELVEPRRHVGFVCATCEQPREWRDANGTARGLVCAACTPHITPQREQSGRLDDLIDRVLRFADAD